MPTRIIWWWKKNAGRTVFAIYLAIVILCTLQRGVIRLNHTTFPIFRASFNHLIHNQDLYAAYPAEQGRKVDDLFKYSPTVALLFAPFAIPPLPAGLLLWNALNAFLLFYAVRRLLGGQRAWLALLLLAPEALVGVQASSSNCLVAALILLAFIGFEERRQGRAAGFIALATFIKLFPLAAAAGAVFHPRRLRFGLLLAGAFVLLTLLPLLVVSPAHLLDQYRSWFGRVTEDATIHRGASVMRMIQDFVPGAWPNWPVQLIGVGLLLLPVLLRPTAWGDPDFRFRFLCSLMVFMVLFNHEAERQTYVVASTGLVLWFLSRPPSPVRAGVLALSLLGVKIYPQTAAWLLMQGDLWGRTESAGRPVPALLQT